MFTNIKKWISQAFCIALMTSLSHGCAEVSMDCEENACGSCGELKHTPGDKCSNGVWMCDEFGDVVCRKQPEQNACGGTAQLQHTPGDGCPNGVWTCDGTDNVVCEIQYPSDNNPCGGTTKLELYGKDCGNCGKYQCDGTDALKCDDPGKNACGSCEELKHAPGDACDDGIWTCSNGSLICKESNTQTQPNACGGSTEITEELGASCGNCGKYECAGKEAVLCNDPGKNACDGCETLEHVPGDPCGECGTYICDSNNSVKCDDPQKNACGGCEPLTAVPDTPCGSGECAKWTCDGNNNIICGSQSMNACGGCETLPHQPGEKCNGEACCTWVCDDHGGIIKDEHSVNACGGCAILDHDPGTSCDDGYGQWMCDPTDSTKNSLKCVCNEYNACGGCNQNKKPGDSCTMCETNQWGDTGVEGHLTCKGGVLTCTDDSNTPETAIELSKYTALDDGMDDIQKWHEEMLEEDSDIDWYYINNVNDGMWGLMQPQFWILGDKGFKLCAYILENSKPKTVNYTCSGTGKDEENSLSMTVSATTSASITLKNGNKYTGFCTKPASGSSYKFIKFAGVETAGVDNSLSAFISVSSDGTRTDACRSYELRYRF